MSPDGFFGKKFFSCLFKSKKMKMKMKMKMKQVTILF
jgi:hypothetical protein